MPVTHAVPRRPSNLDPLTQKQLRDAERDQVYIFNVSPREYRVMLNRLYVIPPCPAGQPYSPPLVIPGMVYSSKVKKVSGLNVEYEWHGDDGIDVARDIVGTAAFKDASEDLTRMGVFYSSSAIPNEVELQLAHQAWAKRCDELIANADALYSINNGMVQLGNGRAVSNIGDDAIQAARYRGVERKWANQSNPSMTQCPHCGVSVADGLAFCPNGDVLNEEKARKARPWLFIEAPRGPGRPPRVEAA